MLYYAISQPENGDAEVVWTLLSKNEKDAREEVQIIANQRCEDVVLASHVAIIHEND